MNARTPAAQKRKSTWWKSRPMIGAASLLVGVGFGASGQASATESTEYVALQEQHARVEHDLFAAENAQNALTAQVTEAELELETLTAEKSHLEAEVANIADREEAVAEQEEALKQRESDVDRKEQALRDREAAVAAAEADTSRAAPVPFTSGSGSGSDTPARAPKPAQTKAPAPKETYYKNCTAVRAAGADPILKGEPGYAKHLDRDGDGIACE